MNWYRGEQYLHDSDTYRITNKRAADSVISTLSVTFTNKCGRGGSMGWQGQGHGPL